jgi:hypothetical protein
MEYSFENRPSGKSFAQMIQLKQNLEKGLNCAVATSNPEKTKRDFEYMTGSELNLKPTNDCVGVYIAEIKEL